MDPYNTKLTLIAKIRDKHNDQAWEEFTYFYKSYIYSIVIKMGVISSERDDLVQKIMLELWKCLPSFEYQPGEGVFRRWLYGVVRNQTYVFFRTNKRYKNKLEKAGKLADTNDNYESEQEVQHEKEWREHLFEIAWDRIKDDLPDNYRECFSLFGQGLDVHQVAEELNIKVNSAHVFRQRVTKRLAREIRFLDSELG